MLVFIVVMWMDGDIMFRCNFLRLPFVWLCYHNSTLLLLFTKSIDLEEGKVGAWE
jgi:hypothetical protein